ncbi:MAG: hypothetical protein KF791_01145 [Verrucomicrobiae bacterium]|nr:hypothetical protein [Verrucomicrobiae bacterium]
MSTPWVDLGSECARVRAKVWSGRRMEAAGFLPDPDETSLRATACARRHPR